MTWQVTLYCVASECFLFSKIISALRLKSNGEKVNFTITFAPTVCHNTQLVLDIQSHLEAPMLQVGAQCCAQGHFSSAH